MIAALRLAVLSAAALLAGLFAYAATVRLAFPYELEWMCGSVLDHVDRVHAGLPVYTAPTTSWIPFLYPPLFYWIAAPLGGSFLACRAVSLVATVAQAICVWHLARRGGASRWWGAVGVLAFFGAYFYVGSWYDVERSDTLCVALVLVAATILVERTSVLAAAIAGAIFGLAFFAKQQALPFVVASVVALAIDRAWRRAGALAAASATVVAAIIWRQDAATQGWFSYYVLRMPAAHGLDGRLWRDVFDYDVPRGLGLVAATVALCAWLVADARRGDRRHLLFALLLGTGGVVALSSRLHVGGWINVLQPWTSFACPAVAILGFRIEASLADRPSRARALAALYAAVLAQLALWAPSIGKGLPDRTLRADTESFLSDVHRLERDGEVLVVGRGHVTKATHFQMSALADVARVDGAPPDLLAALRARRLAAIVDDARVQGGPPLGLWPPVMLEDVPAVRPALFAHYYVAEELDERELRVAMAAPAVPRWVYRARRTPLDESAPDLSRRHFAEMELARKHAPADAIEELAAHETAR
jgi:hypothetical protein